MIPALCGVEKSNTPVFVTPPPYDATPPLSGDGEHKNYLRLAALLIAPGSRARALAPDGENGGAYLGDGGIDELVDAHPDAAVLGKIRPDLLAIDMDGTADWFDDLEEAAAAVGAVRAYLAHSGSPDSLHVVYAPPTTHARRALVDAATRLSAMADGAIDARSPEEWLRLPGSPSLKAGCGPVQPVTPADDGFVPVGVSEALRCAQAALKTRRRDRKALGVPFRVKEFDQDPLAVAENDVREAVDQPLDCFSLRTSCELDDVARRALAVPCPAGADATLHALRAAWHLWRCGYRSWKDVAAIIMRSPALARWRRGGHGEAARRWRMEAAKWAAWRPELSGRDAGLIADAHASAGRLPADLEPVLLAVLEWMQRSGRTDEVPVAVRDLVVWGVAGSVGAAHGALEALEVGGVLVRARRWEDGPAEEATRWSLESPSVWQLGDDTTDSASYPNRATRPLPGGLSFHPVWLHLGPAPRRLLGTLLDSSSPSTASLASVLGLGVSTVRGHLVRLEQAGFVCRIRQGRSVVWTASTSGWTSLPAVRAAEEAHQVRVEKVAAQRAAWRAGLTRAVSMRSRGREESPVSLAADTYLGSSTGLSVAQPAGVVDTKVSAGKARPFAAASPSPVLNDPHNGLNSDDVHEERGEAATGETGCSYAVIPRAPGVGFPPEAVANYGASRPPPLFSRHWLAVSIAFCGHGRWSAGSGDSD